MSEKFNIKLTEDLKVEGITMELLQEVATSKKRKPILLGDYPEPVDTIPSGKNFWALIPDSSSNNGFDYRTLSLSETIVCRARYLLHHREDEEEKEAEIRNKKIEEELELRKEQCRKAIDGFKGKVVLHKKVLGREVSQEDESEFGMMAIIQIALVEDRDKGNALIPAQPGLMDNMKAIAEKFFASLKKEPDELISELEQMYADGKYSVLGTMFGLWDEGNPMLSVKEGDEKALEVLQRNFSKDAIEYWNKRGGFGENMEALYAAIAMDKKELNN